MSIVPACAEESGDGSAPAMTSSPAGSSGDTGGDTGDGGTGGDTGGSSTGGDTGDGGTDGDTGGSSTGGDTGDRGTGGDTGDGGTGGDTGSGGATGGETGGSGIGDDIGTTPVLLTTITPSTLSPSLDGGSGSPDGTGESGSGGARTLAVVTVSLPPPDPIPLNEDSVGDGYIFTGSYDGGSIQITGSGTAGSPKSYYLTADLTTSSFLYAIQISGSHVILDGQDNTGTSHTITCSHTIYGIDMEGEDVTVQNVDVSHFSIGIYSQGDSATITGNTINENGYGIRLLDTVSNTEISGNRITRNSGSGIGIRHGFSGSGSNNAIYDNYLANENNIEFGGGSDISGFTWTRPGGPTQGTNVMGGPTIAGNYWGSNPTGTGWSDNQPANSYGYTTTPYEVVTGSAYDTAPLVPWDGINPYPSPPSQPSGRGPGTPSQQNPTTPSNPISIVITTVTLPLGASPGAATTLAISLENEGSLPLPPQATYVFVPADEAAAEIGEFTATVTNRQFDEVTLPFTVPSEPGVYEYSFTPYLVQTNPLTGEEIRVPAGPPVTFTVTVGDDGSVSVS